MPKSLSRKLFLLLPLLLVSEVAFAGFFTPSAQDKSLSLLGMIFGSNVSHFTGETPSPALAQMFEIFNGIIVGLGTMVVGYVSTISVVNTAQEGTVMGKKWSSIWVPMRSVFGLLLMVPTPGTGYSLIQNTVIWIIVQGVGAADSVWNKVMDNLTEGVSVIAQNQIADLGPVRVAIEETADNVLNSLVCMKTFQKIGSDRAYLDEPMNRQKVHASKFLAIFGSNTSIFSARNQASNQQLDLNNIYDEFATTGTLYVGIPGSSAALRKLCGSYSISSKVSIDDWPNVEAQNSLTVMDIKQMADTIFNVKELALRNMFDVLEPLATAIVNLEIGPRDASSGGSLLPDNITMRGYKNKAIESYVSTISGLIIPGDKMEASVREAAEIGKATGWIDAGAFYFTMQKTMEKNLFPSAKVIPAAENIISFDNYNLVSESINEYLSAMEQAYLLMRLNDAKTYLNADSVNNKPIQEISTSLPAGSGVSQLLKPLNSFSEQAMSSLISLMEDNDSDPLVSHGKFGSFMMFSAEIAWLLTIGFGVTAALTMSTCSATSPMFVGVGVLVFIMMGIVLSLLGILWTAGASMAVYGPMIPFLMFSFGAIGWMIQVIEAIVASPIIALGLVLPAQDEIGKIQNGLFILINIFLRPTLMIFGFVLAAKLYAAAVTFIKYGIKATIATMPISSTLFSWIPMICMYSIIVLAITNKCFALVYILPDKIMRWIGGQAESVGQEQSQSMQEIKQGSERTFEQTKSAPEAASAKALESGVSISKAKFKEAMSGDGGDLPQ